MKNQYLKEAKEAIQARLDENSTLSKRASEERRLVEIEQNLGHLLDKRERLVDRAAEIIRMNGDPSSASYLISLGASLDVHIRSIKEGIAADEALRLESELVGILNSVSALFSNLSYERFPLDVGKPLIEFDAIPHFEGAGSNFERDVLRKV